MYIQNGERLASLTEKNALQINNFQVIILLRSYKVKLGNN